MQSLIDQEFALRPGLLYLNHAAVSPWPRRTADAVSRFAEENLRQGSWDYPGWLETERELREQLAMLINAPSAADVALVKNTSEALSMVAYGIDWRTGENIVSSNEEFPSNRIVWESLADRGVTLRQADLNSGATPEDALFALVDEKTRMIAVSSVQYGTGLRLDLARLGRFCRDHDILFCIDAIQSIGAVQFDVVAIGADFVAADGHKWMLGPEGLGLFYCRAELRDELRLNQFGWHMVEHIGDFDRRDWQPAHSARRFECGSPNMLSIHALHASLSLLLEVDMAEVESRLLAKSRRLLQQIGELPHLQLVTPSIEGRFAGIVTFRPEDAGAEALHQALQSGGLFCAQRAGGIRLSPHFYTPDAVLDRAMARLMAYSVG